jgi:rhamnogalacturonyl hydrolase YesR
MFLAVMLVVAALHLRGALIETEAGLTARQTVIQALLGQGSQSYTTDKRRLLLVGGLDGPGDSDQRVRQAIEWFETSPQAGRWRKLYAVAAIAIANPDREQLQFPPTGEAYAKQTTSHYLWRWIGVHAPDYVLIAGSDPSALLPALWNHEAAGVGKIPGKALAVSGQWLADFLQQDRKQRAGSSPARHQMQARLSRSPKEVAQQLAAHYGHELPEAVYIPALALIGRVRLGALDDVERIVQPFVSGQRNSLDKATASHQSGHLVFRELAIRTRKPAYTDLVRKAADMAFQADGTMKESMPLHNEMSDSFFMGCPILAAAGKLTGETKYFDMCVRHMKFMQKLDWRQDGLFRHSPLDETAWGRGNGFPALGIALSLQDMPRNHPGRSDMLEAFRTHIETLVRYQDATGMWRQVIDKPGVYRELTATCMIAVAMLKGVRNGWLDAATYRPRIERAWEAVKPRVATGGGLIDVCTGTGKQKSLQDYLDRTAILGKDPRGGAMALLFATEMAGLH